MRVAITQLTSTASVDDNYAAVAPLVAAAAAAGARLVALPECFAYMPPRAGASAAVAEPLDGPLFRRYAALAARHNVWLSLGGFHERDGAAVYNTHAVVRGGDGQLVAAYRKAHLFDAALPDGTAFRESDTIRPGGELVAVAHTPVGTLGLSTCYDVRFAGMYRALVGAGAEVLLVPSAFAVGTGRDHWAVLVRARGRSPPGSRGGGCVNSGRSWPSAARGVRTAPSPSILPPLPWDTHKTYASLRRTRAWWGPSSG